MYVFLPLDIEFGSSVASSAVSASSVDKLLSFEEEEPEISSMVNFLEANRVKLMQVCLEDKRDLDLEVFQFVFQKIMENDIKTAYNANKRITAIIINILDLNNIWN